MSSSTCETTQEQLVLSELQIKILHLVSRRVDRRSWIRIRMAGDLPGHELVTESKINRWVRPMVVAGLLTQEPEVAPNFNRLGPRLRLTQSGRDALTA